MIDFLHKAELKLTIICIHTYEKYVEVFRPNFAKYFRFSSDDGFPVKTRDIPISHGMNIKDPILCQEYPILCRAAAENLTLPVDYEVKYIYFFINCY